MVRNFLMFTFHILVYILGVKHINDTQCGFKLFSRKAARLIFPAMHVEVYFSFLFLFLLLSSSSEITKNVFLFFVLLFGRGGSLT
jgi:hypothetical protein